MFCLNLGCPVFIEEEYSASGESLTAEELNALNGSEMALAVFDGVIGQLRKAVVVNHPSCHRTTISIRRKSDPSVISSMTCPCGRLDCGGCNRQRLVSLLVHARKCVSYAGLDNLRPRVGPLYRWGGESTEWEARRKEARRVDADFGAVRIDNLDGTVTAVFTVPVRGAEEMPINEAAVVVADGIAISASHRFAVSFVGFWRRVGEESECEAVRHKFDLDRLDEIAKEWGAEVSQRRGAHEKRFASEAEADAFFQALKSGCPFSPVEDLKPNTGENGQAEPDCGSGPPDFDPGDNIPDDWILSQAV